MFTVDTIIVLLSALVAAGSFVAFALPFLNREEKKERYRSVIEKKRKALFEQSKQQMAQRGKGEKQMSARDIDDIKFAQTQIRNFAQIQKDATATAATEKFFNRVVAAPDPRKY